MNQKNFLLVLGILGVVVVLGGIYTYNVYTSISSVLDEVHTPLNSQQSIKRIEEMKV